MEWLFYALFFLAGIVDYYTKRIPSVIVAPSLVVFALAWPVKAPQFLIVFGALWFFVAVLAQIFNKVALNFVDILYLALCMVLTKNILLFLLTFTVLGYIFWVKFKRKEAPLILPLFLAFLISHAAYVRSV